MIKGIYSSAQGMMSLMTKQDNISNNLANVDTTGYKKDITTFQVVEDSMEDTNTECACDNVTGACSKSEELNKFNEIYKRNSPVVAETFTSFEEGGFKRTDNPLDVAIKGRGFFVVNTPQGRRYTKAGNFTKNSEGNLITKNGNTVAGTGGEINIEGENISIGSDGTVSVDGEIRGTLQIVEFNDLRTLAKVGNDNFRTTENSEQIPVENPVVEQGFLEKSNVNMVKSMVNMIKSYRNYEANQRSIRAQDETLRSAVRDVGMA